MAKNGNGEGGITRHKKSGLYMARYTVETPTGKKRKAVYGKTREEAYEKLIEALSNRNKGLVLRATTRRLKPILQAGSRTSRARSSSGHSRITNTWCANTSSLN